MSEPTLGLHLLNFNMQALYVVHYTVFLLVFLLGIFSNSSKFLDICCFQRT